MSKPDYSTWPTKQQAADTIGCSTKWIERFTWEKRLQMRLWKRPEGGPRIAVYHPEDVARLAAERNPDAEPFVVTNSSHGTENSSEPPAVNGKAMAARTLPSEQVERFVQAVAAEFANLSQNSANREPHQLFVENAGVPNAGDGDRRVG